MLPVRLLPWLIGRETVCAKPTRSESKNRNRQQPTQEKKQSKTERVPRSLDTNGKDLNPYHLW